MDAVYARLSESNPMAGEPTGQVSNWQGIWSGTGVVDSVPVLDSVFAGAAKIGFKNMRLERNGNDTEARTLKPALTNESN